MSAIDIVLVVIALVAGGGCCGLRPPAQEPASELRERGDSSAETLAALEQANNALDALNVALAETRRTANAIAQQQTTDAAVEQQRYLTIAREFSQAGDRMDDLAARRPTSSVPTGEGYRAPPGQGARDGRCPAGCYPQRQQRATRSDARDGGRETLPARSTIACRHRLSR